MASEAYHDWSGEAAGARLRVNFTLKLLLSQNFCNLPLMRFMSFASNIGTAATVPVGPAPAPLVNGSVIIYHESSPFSYSFHANKRAVHCSLARQQRRFES